MKTLHLSIIVILFSVLIILYQTAFAQTAHDILQERDNTPATQLSHNGAILIINQTTSKLEYKMGENITIHPEMINIGTVPVTIINGQPLFDIQVINQNGTTVFDSGYSGMLIVGWGFTLNPGMTMHDNRTWGWNPQATTPVIKLDTPGKYMVLTESNISLYNTAEESSHAIPVNPTKSLWSKPIQITVLPENYVENQTNSSMMENNYSESTDSIKNKTIQSHLGNQLNTGQRHPIVTSVEKQNEDLQNTVFLAAIFVSISVVVIISVFLFVKGKK